MVEALGCITSSGLCQWRLKLASSNNSISFCQRNSKHEVPTKQTKHILFQTNREYANAGKWGGRIVVKVGIRDGDGNEKTQDMLAEIALLETQKIRVAEFVSERSDQLKEIAEQTNSELQQIADCTIKDLDEAGLKVLESVEEEVRACEEELASERAELQRKEQQIDRFEKQSWESRNEGLFFQRLYAPTKKLKEIPPDKKNSIQMEVDILKKVTKQKLNSSFRRNIYLFLILVLSFGLIDAIASGNAEWPKLALYAVLIVILVAQLTYETAFSSKDK